MTEIWQADNDTALLTVDVTYDFLPPNGALAVENGNDVIPLITELATHFNKRVWTKEEHDKDHAFFARLHEGKAPLDTIETEFGEQYLWPDHCVKGTKGTLFHADLQIGDNDLVVVKGTDPTIHAYSAFYMDDRKTVITYEDGKTLAEKLHERGIKKLVVTGLAYDFCAGLTAYDAAKEGFDVMLVRDATKSIEIPKGHLKEDGTPFTTVDKMDEMLAEAGVQIVTATGVAAALGKEPPRNDAAKFVM